MNSCYWYGVSNNELTISSTVAEGPCYSACIGIGAREDMGIDPPLVNLGDNPHFQAELYIKNCWAAGAVITVLPRALSWWEGDQCTLRKNPTLTLTLANLCPIISHFHLLSNTIDCMLLGVIYLQLASACHIQFAYQIWMHSFTCAKDYERGPILQTGHVIQTTGTNF